MRCGFRVVLSTVEVLTSHRINAHFSITGRSNCLLCSPSPNHCSVSLHGRKCCLDQAPEMVLRWCTKIRSASILFHLDDKHFIRGSQFHIERGGRGASGAALSLICAHLVFRYMSVWYCVAALQNNEPVSVMLTAWWISWQPNVEVFFVLFFKYIRSWGLHWFAESVQQGVCKEHDDSWKGHC